MNKSDTNSANSSEAVNAQGHDAVLYDSSITGTRSSETVDSPNDPLEVTQAKPEWENHDAPLVSVIIRSMDRATLTEALDSVALQNYPNIEIVLVNAKGEGHRDLGGLYGRFPVRMICTGEPLKRSRAANTGIDAARGDYLIFLDDDDWFMPEHIGHLVRAIEAHPGVGVVYSGVICVDEHKNPLPETYAKPFDGIQLLATNYIPIHAALFLKALPEKGCRFDESLDFYEDWDFWIQASHLTDFKFVGGFSAVYRIGPQSGFGVNFDRQQADQASAIVYEKWFPRLKGDKLLQISHLVRSYDANQRTIGALYGTIHSRDVKIDELETRIDALTCELDAKKEELMRVYDSRSWKITKPLRDMRASWTPARSVALFVARKLWAMLPVSAHKKTWIKRWLANTLPAFRHGSSASEDLTHESVWGDSPFEAMDRYHSGYEAIYRRGLETSRNALSSPDYVPQTDDPSDLTRSDIKLIAFYLPQYHPIPENDREWGKGFTEWTNVSKAMPQFVGHYQPRFPGELGFYDLRIKDVQRRQIELARQYGIHGFCYHHYWFDGHKVLDGPFQQVLADPTLDLPFCLCWANENWTRRWDGGENEIILAQKHSPEDDLAFIKDLEPAMRDARYIRIDGKPLLIVYRPELLPDPKATAQRWRNHTIAAGIGDLFIAAAATFGFEDYPRIGYDGLVQFPPNNISATEITHKVRLLNKNYQGHVYDYVDFASQALRFVRGKKHTFPCVMMEWDNEARKSGKGHTFQGCSPQNYKNWLSSALELAAGNSTEERLVFINAWNEWAEGTYLEPDRRYGYAYLQATRDALKANMKMQSERKIVLVSHDAHPHGAQYLVLHMARMLSEEFDFDVALVVLGEGILMPEYARVATTHDLTGVDHGGRSAVLLAQRLAGQGYRAALVNSTVSGLFLKTLADAGLHCVALIHELPGIIDAHRLHGHARTIAAKAAAVVFPARQVADSFPHRDDMAPERIHIKPQGLYKHNAFKGDNDGARKLLRKELDLAESDKIVLGVGYADYRKGVDLFVETGLQLSARRPDVRFVWLGHWDGKMEKRIQQRLTDEPLAKHFLFPGRRNDTDIFYAGADVFALTSREDPFPSVTMESLSVSVPVVGFEGAGGSENLLKQGCGILVAQGDCTGFANAIDDLLNDASKTAALGSNGAELIEASFSFRHYLFDLLDIAGFRFKRVSAIVPNYNYARFLTKRLDSILSQTYPLFELIVLDDNSTDDSLDVIARRLAKSPIEHRVIKNRHNSGSVFKQWRKAAELARGDLVWIAEADDDASPVFLEKSLPFFDDAQLVMSYTQSQQMDENGAKLNDHYLDYTNDIDAQKWCRNYINDGPNEIATVLAIKNTIPNVSAAVFRKSALQNAFAECERLLPQLNIAGDWLIYTTLLRHGKIGYIAESLNAHRRHQKSVTASSSSHARHLAEILFMQQYIQDSMTVSASVKTKTVLYAENIFRQFGLAGEGVSKPEEHERVQRALSNIRHSGIKAASGKNLSITLRS